MKFEKIVAVLLSVATLSLGGCFGGSKSSAKLREKATPTAYALYLQDDAVRNQVDREWLEVNATLLVDGADPVPHPYGDKNLKSSQVLKVRTHEYSGY